MNTTRRNVLRTAAAFSLVFRLPELHAADPEPAVFSPNAYLQITDDGTVTLWATHLEMGQGVRTLLPMILAEELEADRSRVRVEQASPGDRFKAIRLHTSGSGSSSGSYRTLRIAGAAAKEMLIAAAASDWNVEPRSCAARLGEVIHTETNRRRAFGTLVVSASAQPVPRSPALKKPADFTVLGKPIKRVDGPAIVTGRAQYGMDIRIPGMLYASIEHAPTLGGTLVQFDAEAAHKVPGVRNVVAVTSGIHPGVAVVADDNWAAMKGREALRVEWATDRHASFDSESFLQDLWRSPDHTTFSVRHEGAATEALASAHARHEASYMWPFQAHAAMETMNCTARVTAEAVEVWAPTQTDVRTLAQLKKVTGLPDSATTLHCTLMGGGFGRRLFADYAAEAAEISEAIG
ncbi:MAG: aldehyde oxidase and xanthine dehydrogenase molybdopterin binding protein, partial [Bryobacterales bacterium]|nr:aldehyde oxidase and xanthine dehydrogenase molybdopterin binding protein [Bryobacterales bacterium]